MRDAVIVDAVSTLVGPTRRVRCGAVLTCRMAHHLADNGIDYGLQSMCEAAGLAHATILETL